MNQKVPLFSWLFLLTHFLLFQNVPTLVRLGVRGEDMSPSSIYAYVVFHWNPSTTSCVGTHTLAAGGTQVSEVWSRSGFFCLSIYSFEHLRWSEYYYARLCCPILSFCPVLQLGLLPGTLSWYLHFWWKELLTGSDTAPPQHEWWWPHSVEGSRAVRATARQDPDNRSCHVCS